VLPCYRRREGIGRSPRQLPPLRAPALGHDASAAATVAPRPGALPRRIAQQGQQALV